MNLNRVFLAGFCSRDPEIKTIGDTQVAVISLPTSRKYQDRNGAWQEKTQWHTLEVWGKSALFVEKYVRKGSQIYAEGEVEYRTWETSNGNKGNATSILVSRVELLSSKPIEQPAPQPKPQYVAPTPQPTPAPSSGGDDLPF